MTITACVLMTVAVALAVRSARRGGGLPAALTTGVLIMGELAAVAGGAAWQQARLDARLSAVSSRVAQASDRVHCQTGLEALWEDTFDSGYVGDPHIAGVTFVDEQPARVIVKQKACHDLVAYLHSDKAAPSLAAVEAVHVLSHESMHAGGYLEEAVAECHAVQHDAQTAQLLGATTAQARALATTYWSQLYPRMDDDYRSAECRAGGQLAERWQTWEPWDAAP